MNQILSTSMPMDNKKKKEKKVNTNPVAIKSILKFFAIAMLIFGIFTIGTGAYAVFKNQSEQQEQNLEPSISIEDKDEETILLKVVHKKNIAKLEYRWNDEESTVVNGNNGKYIEKQIKVPSGKNTLHVLVVDDEWIEIVGEITKGKYHNSENFIFKPIYESKSSCTACNIFVYSSALISFISFCSILSFTKNFPLEKNILYILNKNTISINNDNNIIIIFSAFPPFIFILYICIKALHLNLFI